MVKWGNSEKKPSICKPCLKILNFFYTGGFFTLQTLSSIILIASHLYRFVHGKAKYHLMRKLRDWVILDSALQVTQVSCFFLSHCYGRFIALWATLLICFGIRMQKYCHVSRGMWSSLTVGHFTAVCCVNIIYRL